MAKGGDLAREQAALLSLYPALVNSVQLRAVDLFESSARFFPDALSPGAIPDSLNIKLETSGYRSAVIEAEAGNPRILYCGVKLGVSEVYTDDTKKPPETRTVLSVSAEYGLFYAIQGNTECPEALANRFASRNGVFNAWPFFRELAHSLVSRMNVPPLVIPLFRLPPDIPPR